MALADAVLIRPLTAADLTQVAEVERHSFPNAWTVHEMRRFLNCPSVAAFAATIEAAVVGFAFVERCGAESHILNFAVHPDHRRGGVGRRLMETLRENARSQGATRIRLEVRETNVGAQVFYRTLGFRATRILRAHYRDSMEDGYRMEGPVLDGVEAAAPVLE